MTSANNAFTVSVEQPQGLCDLIGQAFRIWRRNLKLIFRTLLMPTILYFGSTSLLQWCLTYGITSSAPNFSAAELPRIAVTALVGFATLIVLIGTLFWLSFRQLALVRLFTGFAPDWQKAVAFMRKRFWWLPGLFLISVLMSSVLVGIWVCMIALSGIASGTGPAGAVIGTVGMVSGLVGIFISVMLIMLVCMMGFSVLACEETTFFGVIGRSFYWTFKHFGRVICFGFIYYIILSVVSIPVSLPVIIASIGDVFVHQLQTGTATSSADYKLSLAVMLFIQVWDGICSLLIRPVTAICFGLFYLDLRRRVDGIDMTRKLRELKLAAGGAENGLQGH